MAIIDLRSDTVTLPTPAMREAISRAEVEMTSSVRIPQSTALKR